MSPSGGSTEPPWWRRPGRRAPVVLLYHGFAEGLRDDDPENLFVPLREFSEQLAWLRDEGWTPLSWAEYDAVMSGRSPRPRRSFLVTIDDAYASTREGVEVLAQHDVPSIVYTPAGLIGATAEWLPEPCGEPLLAAADLRSLAGPLVEFGVHGWDHTALVDRDPDELSRQTTEAWRTLQDAVGDVVPSFAYPFGDHDPDSRRAVERAGFTSAFSVFDDVGRFAVSRVDVNATDSLPSFRLKLMPGYRRAWRTLDRASFVRRAVRRVLTSADDA